MIKPYQYTDAGLEAKIKELEESYKASRFLKGIAGGIFAIVTVLSLVLMSFGYVEPNTKIVIADLILFAIFWFLSEMAAFESRELKEHLKEFYERKINEKISKLRPRTNY